MDKSNQVIKSSAIVFGTIILAKLAALGEDAVVASAIGTSSNADAYYMSADILQLFWYFGTLGIVRVYLPEYKKQLTLHGGEQAEKYATNMKSFFTIFAVLITGIIVLFATFLVNIMAYGFSFEAKEMCTKYVRLRTPQIVFWCWTALASAKLQSQNKFLSSKIPEIIVHIPVIVLAVLMFERYGVNSLFWGLIIGSVFGLLVQLPFLKGTTFFKFRFHLKEQGVIASLKRMPAAFVSAALTQIHSIVDKVMASAQPAGAVSALSYGHKMYTAVNGLISGAISTVAYPKITEYVAANDNEGLKKFIRTVLSLLLSLLIPFSIAFILFSPDLTKLLFMRGAFGQESVNQVADVFSAYAIGLSFAGIMSIVQLVFFAYGNTKVPMYTSMISIACNVILNLLLVKIWGATGIAIASSIALIIACCSLTIVSKKYVTIIDGLFLLRVGKIIFASLLSCISAYCVALFFLSNVPIIVRLLCSALVGTAIYCPLILLFDRDIYTSIKNL